jgi:hypothetical protein
MIKKILSNSYLFVFILVSIYVIIKTNYSLMNIIIFAVGLILLGLFSIVGNNTKYITMMIKDEMNSNDFEHISNSYKGTFKLVCWFISLGLSILQIILIV